MLIGVKKIIDDVASPMYATEGSAGFDLRAMRIMALYRGSKKVDLSEKMGNTILTGHVTLRPGERALFGTGVSMAIPQGYEIQIRDKSGIALKRGLQVFNSPGTIDSDFIGEIGIIICNTTPYLAQVTLGEFIAQGVLTSYEKAEFYQIESHESTVRGKGAYGSTGNGLPN